MQTVTDEALAAAKTRLDASQIALDEAIITRMTNEPWRIAKALWGHAVWPCFPYETIADALRYAEQEHRFLLRIHGWEKHPAVWRADLCVRALLTMVL